MPYFKERPAQMLKKPLVHRVWFVQLIATILAGIVVGLVNPIMGFSVAIGGLICVIGQAFYVFRALTYFGDRDATKVLASTFSALWGKWLIIVMGSLVVVMQFDQISASALYVGLFGIHTFGALLLPVLVK